MNLLNMLFKNRHCKKLGTRLNIAFGIVLSVPVITYYSHKTEQEAVAKIGPYLKIAGMMLSESVAETEKLAAAYARKKEIAALVSFGLREKLGGALEKDAEKDNLDLICVIDRSFNCIVHSCSLPHAGASVPVKQTEAALSGLSSAGIVIMTEAEIKAEGTRIKIILTREG